MCLLQPSNPTPWAVIANNFGFKLAQFLESIYPNTQIVYTLALKVVPKIGTLGAKVYTILGTWTLRDIGVMISEAPRLKGVWSCRLP